MASLYGKSWVWITYAILGFLNGQAQSVQPLVIKGVSATAPLPLTPLYVSTAGLDSSAPLTIQFSNVEGFSAKLKPIRIDVDGTVVVATPLYLTPGSKDIGPGVVGMQLAQGDRSSAIVLLTIQDLPPVSAYSTKPGEISHAVLVLNSLLAARRLGQFEAYKQLSSSIDSTNAQEILRRRLLTTLQVRREVERIANDRTISIPAGLLANNTVVRFDANALDIMDRVNAVFLLQAFSSLVQPELGSAPTAVREYRFAQPRGALSKELKDILERIKTVAALRDIGLNAAKGAVCSSTAGCSLVENVDQGAALAGGIVGLMADSKRIVSDAATSRQLGAFGALISDAYIIGDSFGDIGAFAYAYATDNSELMSKVVEDVNDNSKRMNQTIVDLVVASPMVQGIKGVGLVSSALWSLGKIAWDTWEDDRVSRTTSATLLSFRTMAEMLNPLTIIGSTIEQKSAHTLQAQTGITVSSNGVTFENITDDAGHAEIQVPKRSETFDYAHAQIDVTDPTTGIWLGTKSIDISAAQTAQTALTMPPITVAYPDRPTDYDPAYCTEVVHSHDEGVLADIKNTQESIDNLLVVLAMSPDDPYLSVAIPQEIELLQKMLTDAVQELHAIERFFLQEYGCWEELATAPATNVVWP